MALTKIKTLRASETYNVNSINANTVTVAGTSVTGGGGGTSSFPGILTIKVTSNNYSFLDDTSVNTSGGFIQVGGVNFNANCTLLIGSNNVTSSALVNTTTIQAQVPAAAAGTYHVYLIDSVTGYTAIKPNGLTHSPFPVWGTANTLSGVTSNTNFNTTLSANSDSNIVYSNTTVLPTGSTLLANGYFYGNVSVGATTTFSFDAKATDVELQDTSKTFSLTVTKPSAVYYSYLFPSNGAALVVGNGQGNSGSPSRPKFSVDPDFIGRDEEWTVEGWFKCLGSNGDEQHIFQWSGGTNLFMRVAMGNNGSTWREPSLATYYGDNSLYPNININYNTWYHFALCRINQQNYVGAYYLYLNGTLVNSTTTPSSSYNHSNFQGYDFNIGAQNAVANQYMYRPFNGYISNLRFTRYLRVYTGDFTVPTSPLTNTQSASTNIAAITNVDGPGNGGRVMLLTAQSSTIIDNSVNALTITDRSGLSGGGTIQRVAVSPFS